MTTWISLAIIFAIVATGLIFFWTKTSDEQERIRRIIVIALGHFLLNVISIMICTVCDLP